MQERLQFRARVRINFAAQQDFFENWRGPNHNSSPYDAIWSCGDRRLAR